MFIVLLRFSRNKAQVSQHMDAHNAWIRRGFEDDVFVLAGSLPPGLGGGLLAHNTSLSDLQARVDRDPFVAHDVVAVDIVELAPGRVDPRLAFLAA